MLREVPQKWNAPVARIYREWIDNRRTLVDIVKDMHTISRKASRCFLPQQQEHKSRITKEAGKRRGRKPPKA